MPSFIQSCFWSILSTVCRFFYHPLHGFFSLFFPVVKGRPLDIEEAGETAEAAPHKDTTTIVSTGEHGQPSQTEYSRMINQSQQLSRDPYDNLPVVGIGLTGVILKIDEDRVVKIAKVYPLEHLPEPDRSNMEYINDINRNTLKHEIRVYERLGSHKGIISCFNASEYGIELAFAKQGNLECYIETNPEPQESFKVGWILALTETLSYVHSRRVFVDEIALRNFLVIEGQLKLADFGQSILLPLTADVDTICENDLTAKIEILHLGWIIYSIALWRVHKYYFFDRENLHWPKPQELPEADNLFCGNIIKKCWNGEYASMDALNEETHSLLGGVTS